MSINVPHFYLNEQWIKYLADQGESGMDYQIMTVTLKDGRVIENVVVLSCTIVLLPKQVTFSELDIQDMKRDNNFSSWL